MIDNSCKRSTFKFSSHQPLQFYALGYDDFDEATILSGPITFKNLLPETEMFSADGKSAKTSETFDVMTDLDVYNG